MEILSAFLLKMPAVLIGALLWTGVAWLVYAALRKPLRWQGFSFPKAYLVMLALRGLLALVAVIRTT